MPEPSLEDIPEAVPAPKRNWSPQLVWIIPIVAAIIGGWIAVHTILQRGPTATITFLTAEGLEPGKTQIRYKDVNIGEVTGIAISEDRHRIIVTAQFVKEATKFLMEDTRFWVVRPQISGGQISGFGTLLSGAYIAVDVGHSDQPQRQFTGLEVAPIITGDLPGRQFMLEAPDLGSLEIGSPVYFRRIKVGQVVASELDPTGNDVHLLVFVYAPYDRYVTTATRFWNASGVDVSLDAGGMKVETLSLASVLTGGIAFEAPPNTQPSDEAGPGTAFPLFKDRATAMKTPDGEAQNFVLNFSESLRGLAPGAPVDFRGIVVGEVQSVDVQYEAARKWFHFPVRVALYPRRMAVRAHDNAPAALTEPDRDALLKTMIGRGFRAQLRTGNLLTGQLYIALDFFPDAPPVQVDWNRKTLELPTVPGTVEELQQSMGKLLKKLDKVPFDDIGANANHTLASLNATTKSLDQLIKRLDNEVAPESRAALADLRKTLAQVEKTLASDSPLQQDLSETLRETTRAARSLRSLTNMLDREPESLIRGKTDE
ncbi:PqiB family protein [Methylomagnum sp.]